MINSIGPDQTPRYVTISNVHTLFSIFSECTENVFCFLYKYAISSSYLLVIAVFIDFRTSQLYHSLGIFIRRQINNEFLFLFYNCFQKISFDISYNLCEMSVPIF